MGADLMLTLLVTQKDTQLNWGAGIAAALNLDEEEANVVAGECDAEDDGEARTKLVQAIRYLGIGDTPRDFVHFTIAGYRVYASAGMSWGDNPTDAYGYMELIGWAPTVLSAIGFLTDWPED